MCASLGGSTETKFHEAAHRPVHTGCSGQEHDLEPEPAPIIRREHPTPILRAVPEGSIEQAIGEPDDERTTHRKGTDCSVHGTHVAQTGICK